MHWCRDRFKNKSIFIFFLYRRQSFPSNAFCSFCKPPNNIFKLNEIIPSISTFHFLGVSGKNTHRVVTYWGYWVTLTSSVTCKCKHLYFFIIIFFGRNIRSYIKFTIHRKETINHWHINVSTGNGYGLKNLQKLTSLKIRAPHL